MKMMNFKRKLTVYLFWMVVLNAIDLVRFTRWIKLWEKINYMLFYFYTYNLIVTFLMVSMVVSMVLFSLTHAFSKKIKDDKKLLAYECGFNSYSSASIMFDVHFFIVGLLFLMFDVELIFLYPWSMAFSYLTGYGVFSVYFFLLMIIVGYMYEWQKGALSWVMKC